MAGSQEGPWGCCEGHCWVLAAMTPPPAGARDHLRLGHLGDGDRQLSDVDLLQPRPQFLRDFRHCVRHGDFFEHPQLGEQPEGPVPPPQTWVLGGLSLGSPASPHRSKAGDPKQRLGRGCSSPLANQGILQRSSQPACCSSSSWSAHCRVCTVQHEMPGSGFLSLVAWGQQMRGEAGGQLRHQLHTGLAVVSAGLCTLPGSSAVS